MNFLETWNMPLTFSGSFEIVVILIAQIELTN